MTRLISYSLSDSRAGVGNRTRQCATPDCLILQYRRVALLSHDPLRLAVQPHHFERQMEYLAANCNVISLRELSRHLETGIPWRNRTVAVTFDGGYSDVLYTAKDVLERFEVPATVFVPSVHLMERTHFWWDVLEDALIAGEGASRAFCPDTLVIKIGSEPRGWSLASQHDRFRAFAELYDLLSDEPPAAQKRILTQIVARLGGSGEDGDGHATLGAPELCRLEEGGLLTIGGHTHHGVKLARLSEAEQRHEIVYNKRVLEEVLGHRIESFAYPYGDAASYTTATQEILNDCGFRSSCRVACDSVRFTGADSLYELPRLRIQDWNPYTFHRYLETFFG